MPFAFADTSRVRDAKRKMQMQNAKDECITRESTYPWNRPAGQSHALATNRTSHPVAYPRHASSAAVRPAAVLLQQDASKRTQSSGLGLEGEPSGEWDAAAGVRQGWQQLCAHQGNPAIPSQCGAQDAAASPDMQRAAERFANGGVRRGGCSVRRRLVLNRVGTCQGQEACGGSTSAKRRRVARGV